jgi:microcystin degradation protein MlrC
LFRKFEDSNIAAASDTGTAHRRVLVAALFHETHAFLEGTTGWDAFKIHRGDEMLQLSGEASPLGGVLEFANAHGWHVLPTISAAAVPSATVADDVWTRYWDEFASLAKPHLQEGIDAVFLVLHGAMVCESVRDVEGEFLRRLRVLLNSRELPVFGVFDLHANLSSAMADESNCLVAYRENPHWDARDSAVRAAGLLANALHSGDRPHQVIARLPIVWPPTGTASSVEPMKRLLALARQLEAEHPTFYCVNVVPGFAFSDTVDTGVRFGISTIGTKDEALAALDRLSILALELAECGNVVESNLGMVLQDIVDHPVSGLTVLAEPTDNIGAGAPGDGTGLLRGLIQYEIQRAAICLCDPQSVLRLENRLMGEVVTLDLGGRGSRFDAGPLTLDCELRLLSDGLFELEDKQSHLASLFGSRFDMGRAAVVRHAGITILLTSQRTPPMDLGQWHHMGVAVEDYSVVGVKAAVAHRRAYDAIAVCHFWVDTPGPCSSRLERFAYENIERPCYPFDLLATIKSQFVCPSELPNSKSTVP